jgi:hypothetical protein
VSLTAADRGEVFHVPSAARALSGLVISGLLFGFLGAILPAWGYHLTSDFSTIGNYFLAMSVGVILSTEAACCSSAALAPCWSPAARWHARPCSIWHSWRQPRPRWRAWPGFS